MEAISAIPVVHNVGLVQLGCWWETSVVLHVAVFTGTSATRPVLVERTSERHGHVAAGLAAQLDVCLRLQRQSLEAGTRQAQCTRGCLIVMFDG
jgi:hypothetical protein